MIDGFPDSSRCRASPLLSVKWSVLYEFSTFAQEKAVCRTRSKNHSKSVNFDLSLSVDGPAPGVVSLPNDRWAVLKERFKNITLLGLAGPAAETWLQDCTDR